ncbi:MAG: RNA polymerase sigma factor [Planctomycetota bacterium]|jgi:RNA polymerase sigma-70 factor (ECF subfamily)
MQSDEELINKVLDGRREAFAVLVKRYQRPVRAEAMAVMRDYHAAQDIVQEAFVNAYQQLGTLRDGSAFGTWILKITRRRALTSIRRNSKTIQLNAPDDIASIKSNRQLDEASQQLLAAVMKLPEHERSVVMLKYFEDHTIQDISQMTGKPVNTVKVQLSRARARLRKRLKGDKL